MRTQRIFQPARQFTLSIVCSLPSSVLVILAELDRVALAHKAFTEDALGLIVRSSEGILRAAKNLLRRIATRGRERPRQDRRPQTGQSRPAAAALETGVRPELTTKHNPADAQRRRRRLCVTGAVVYFAASCGSPSAQTRRTGRGACDGPGHVLRWQCGYLLKSVRRQRRDRL